MDSPILLPYQRRYLQDQSRWKAACWARQTGKTFTSTLEAVLDCLEAEVEGRISRWTILSISRDRAIDAIRQGVILHLRAIGAAYEELTDDTLDAEELAHMVRFPGGSYIRAIAARPETARGMSDHLLLDEFAHHRDNRIIWRALVPVVSKPGLKLRVISTPNGLGDMFHEIMSDGFGLFSRHVVTIHDAVADGLPRDIDELRRAARDPDTWAQEFECVFLDRAGSEWLAYDEILAALDAEPLPPYGGDPCFVGMDIAARGDRTVIAVLEQPQGARAPRLAERLTALFRRPSALTADALVLRELIVMRGETFSSQLSCLDEVFRRYRVVRCAIDQTGMGEMPVQEAQRRHGQYRVRGVIFTAAAKLDLAVAMKDRLQARRLLLPRAAIGDEVAVRDCIEDLRAVKMTVGSAGLPRLLAERTGSGHADRFWAIALACAAAGDKMPVYEYQSLERRAFSAARETARREEWAAW